ncbi:DUF6223 family protein [Streptomyces xantholiticus]
MQLVHALIAARLVDEYPAAAPATADVSVAAGGTGTGPGRTGAVVAALVGMISVVVGGLALARSRRAGDPADTVMVPGQWPCGDSCPELWRLGGGAPRRLSSRAGDTAGNGSGPTRTRGSPTGPGPGPDVFAYFGPAGSRAGCRRGAGTGHGGQDGLGRPTAPKGALVRPQNAAERQNHERQWGLTA